MDQVGGESDMRLHLARQLWDWEPHPTQFEWLSSEARVKVASCGRRWGKTEAAAIDVATTAIVFPGCVQMVVAPTYDQSRLIFNTVEQLLTESRITRISTKVTRTPYPRLTLGRSVIMARTVDEDGRNLRGHSADRVIVDEAAYVRDSVVLEVLSPMLADSDGQLVMISTPFGKNHFYRAFVRGQNVENREEGIGNSCVSRHESFTFPSWSNPHISRSYIEEQRRELSPRQFAVEYEAQFLDDQNSVFVWDDIRAAVERGRVDYGPAECVVVGIDWARYSDYTAMVAVAVMEQGCVVIGVDRFNRLGWSSQAMRACEFVRRHRASAVLTDATAIGDPVTDQFREALWSQGIDATVDGMVFTNTSKRDMVDHLAMRFAQGSVAIPDHEQLVSELQYFEYELTDSGNIRMNARSGYHDDLVMALALACKQARSVGVSSGGYLAGRGRVAAERW